MAQPKQAKKFDRVFKVSIVLKALDGLLETIGGILLLFVHPEAIQHVVRMLTQHELSKDPNDFIASHIVQSAQHLTAGTTFYAALYLLSHGISKVILVVEIFRGHLWAYKGLMILLSVFIVYQLYRLVIDPSFGLVILTIFDTFVLVLTVREERRQRERLQEVT
jgi:uncharacterized membrane protein